MRLNVLMNDQRNLARGAAVLLIGGLAAGCSSNVARFNGVDNVFTATTNQRQIIAPASQPYPGGATNGGYGQPAGNVARSALPPVGGGSQVASTEPAAAPSAAPQAGAPRTVQSASPAMAKPASAAHAQPTPAAATSTGGQITVQPGDTVYGLSRRFNVPVGTLLAANGLPENVSLKTGQKLVVPGFGGKAGNTQAQPKVASAEPEHTLKLPDAQGPKVPPPPVKAGSEMVSLPQPPKAAPATPGTYKVAQGDTLSKIARKTGVGIAALKAANKIDDGVLSVGQTLVVPAAGSATIVASAPAAKVDQVTTGATAPAVKPGAVAKSDHAAAAATPPKKAEKVIDDAEKDAAAAPDATGIGRMRWPVRGRVISGFGSGGGKNGDGIDIAVPEGTPVKAAENGVVIYAGDGLKEFGNTVLVRHEDGLVTVYGHASELKVARGDKVKRGQEIAVSGMSGTTDTPKLHFEVRKNSSPVDPKTYLE